MDTSTVSASIGFLKRVCGLHEAARVGAQARHAKALLLEPLCRHEHRLVLDVRHDDVWRERARGHTARFGSGGGNPQKHRVVGLGRARREDDFARAGCADVASDRLARGFERLESDTAGRMERVRVHVESEVVAPTGKIGLHGLERPLRTKAPSRHSRDTRNRDSQWQALPTSPLRRGLPRPAHPRWPPRARHRPSPSRRQAQPRGLPPRTRRCRTRARRRQPQ